MEKELKYETFDNEYNLCEWVNDNNIDVVSITTWNKFVVFYWY